MPLQRRAGRALTVVSRWNSAALLGLRSGWHCLTRSRYAAFNSLREAPGRTPSTASWEGCLMATGGIRQERSREACKGRGQAAWASATRPVSPEAAQRPRRTASRDPPNLRVDLAEGAPPRTLRVRRMMPKG